jgi:acyl carrier protein
MRRKDDLGHSWTDRGVERTVIRIVRRLSPGFARKPITRKTRLHQDLGWDELYALRVVKPIRTQLHEQLEDRAVLDLRTVGDLVACVWNAMEVPA